MPATNPRLAAIAVTVGSDFDAFSVLIVSVLSIGGLPEDVAVEGPSEVSIVVRESVVAMVTVGVSVVVVLVGTPE